MAVNRQAQEAGTAPGPSGGATVLVVDDEKLIRWSVGERLARQGYQVKSAQSGEEALQLMALERPDLVVLDVRLPGIDGVETLRRALRLHPGLAAVMMSAHGTVDIAVEAMKDGAVDFLVKPFPLGQLDVAVRRALAAASTRRLLSSNQPTHAGDASHGGMVGQAPAFAQLVATLSRLATGSSTVLVLGESGSGKELVARSIHYGSPRAQKPFLQLNCAALPEQLLESELFGHERGAFTDAHAQKKGLFEDADGGTVMLDEIGDLPPGGQAKLLRLLENKTFRRVGGSTEQSVDVRVIAATNVNLEERVREQRFRADLFFRLNVIRVQVPALRERVGDIPLLAAHFVGRLCEELGRPRLRGISPRALDSMCAYPWPGNVRELRNAMERALILHPEATELRVEHLPLEVTEARRAPAPARPTPPDPEGNTTLSETERRVIVEGMEKAQGNQTHAAKLLGISRDTLRYRLRKFGLL